MLQPVGGHIGRRSVERRPSETWEQLRNDCARTPGKRRSRADQKAGRINKIAVQALSAKPPSPVQIRAAPPFFQVQFDHLVRRGTTDASQMDCSGLQTVAGEAFALWSWFRIRLSGVAELHGLRAEAVESPRRPATGAWWNPRALITSSSATCGTCSSRSTYSCRPWPTGDESRRFDWMGAMPKKPFGTVLLAGALLVAGLVGIAAFVAVLPRGSNTSPLAALFALMWSGAYVVTAILTCRRSRLAPLSFLAAIGLLLFPASFLFPGSQLAFPLFMVVVLIAVLGDRYLRTARQQPPRGR